MLIFVLPTKMRSVVLIWASFQIYRQRQPQGIRKNEITNNFCWCRGLSKV